MLPDHFAHVSRYAIENTLVYYDCYIDRYYYHPEKNLVVQAGELKTFFLMKKIFFDRRAALLKRHQQITERKNKKIRLSGSGVFNRYKYPVLTSEHIPLNWRFDLN